MKTIEQYDLFPAYAPNIKALLIDFSPNKGNLKLALGISRRGSAIWKSVVAFDCDFSSELQYYFLENGHLSIKNPEHLTKKLGIKFPSLDKSYPNQDELIVYIENIYIANFLENCQNTPPSIGWWDSDYGGYGSKIKNPKVWAKEDIKDKNVLDCFLSRFGFMANDLVKNDSINQNTIFEKIFIEKLVLPALKGMVFKIGEGHYPGRPLGMRREIEGEHLIKIKNIEDLARFAIVGLYFKRVK